VTFKWEEVKWSEGLGNRLSFIIRRYIDHLRFASYMAVSLITFFRILDLFSIIVYMVVCFVCFCLVLWIMYSFCCVFFFMFTYSYCYVCSFLGILFHCVVCVFFVCKCVLYYCHRVSTQLQLKNMSCTLSRPKERFLNEMGFLAWYEQIVTQCIYIVPVPLRPDFTGYSLPSREVRGTRSRCYFLVLSFIKIETYYGSNM
jgi:hypothetical protein